MWLTFNPRGIDLVALCYFSRLPPQCRQSSLMLTLPAPLCTLPAPQCQMLRSEFSSCLAAEWHFVLWTKQSPAGSHVLCIHHVSTFPASLSLPPGSLVDDVLSLSQSNCGERWGSPWWGWAHSGAALSWYCRTLHNLLSSLVPWGNYSFKAGWKQQLKCIRRLIFYSFAREGVTQPETLAKHYFCWMGSGLPVP